jgi:hypothetical protein
VVAVPNTKPLSDAFTRVATYANDVVTDEQVRDSVRRLGVAVVDVGRAVAQVSRNRPAAGSGHTVTVPPPE